MTHDRCSIRQRPPDPIFTPMLVMLSNLRSISSNDQNGGNPTHSWIARLTARSRRKWALQCQGRVVSPWSALSVASGQGADFPATLSVGRHEGSASGAAGGSH